MKNQDATRGRCPSGPPLVGVAALRPVCTLGGSSPPKPPARAAAERFRATVCVPWLFVLFVCSVAAFFVNCLLLSDIFSLELKDSFFLIYRFIGRKKTAAAVFFWQWKTAAAVFVLPMKHLGFCTFCLSDRIDKTKTAAAVFFLSMKTC